MPSPIEARYKGEEPARQGVFDPMRPTILCVLFCLACQTTGKPEADSLPMIPSETWDRLQEPTVHSDGETLDPSTGALLQELDGLITAWNNQVLGASSGADDQKFRVIDAKLRHRTTKFTSELIQTLQTGPTRNRQVAAMALGFSQDERPQGPLLAALEDREVAVRANAAFALGLRGSGQAREASLQTPLGGLLALMEDEDGECRSNASWAVKELIRAGSEGEAARAPARRALVDPEARVRVHAITILGLLGAEEALDDLAVALESEFLLVLRAASASITRIGQTNPHAKGRAARMLAAQLTKNQGGPRRKALLVDLARLAERNYGEESEPWIEWAGRLPLE